MLIVPTNISDAFIMAEISTNIEDLEDGEIESEDEEITENQNQDKNEDVAANVPDRSLQEKTESHDTYYSKSGKKKKSKSSKGEQKSKDKSKKSRRYGSPPEDDFAGNIEKAIRKAMNKNDCEEIQTEEDEDRRKHKKRKKYDGKDGSSKKKKKQEYSDDMDENEMMCIRGASPVQKNSPEDAFLDEEQDSYGSDSSHESRGHSHRQQRHRTSQRDRNKNERNKNDRRRNAHPMQDPDGVCLYFMQGKDVDMRFQPSVSLPVSEEVSDKVVLQSMKDMIDIDQYTKDALKFASKDKENIDISNETFDNDKEVISNESKDVDHRVLPFSDDVPRVLLSSGEKNHIKKECDTDIRFLQPEPLFKSSEKRNRRSTTDDEDNNLLIDEKWYSSDEEKGMKKKSPILSPQDVTTSPQHPAPHVIEPSSVLSKIGDLSKIDISEEVTKLLYTMKNNLQENKSDNNSESIGSPKLRDPRSRRSPEKLTDTQNKIRKSSRVSIYECIDGEPTDGRRRTDVDLRKNDFNVPTFGDTDLRQSSSGDIDFRLGLPFKAIPNYTPASEINASINSHPPIPYKVVSIYIPRPDYTDIRNSTAKSQALLDPRLRKVFRLSTEESNSDNEKSSKPAPTGPRVDPRRKPKESNEILDQKPNTLELQTILQNSNWYKELSSTQKIFVNQHLAPVTQMIKQHQQEKPFGKKFDLSSIQNNSILGSIFTNLGISLGENGEYSYLPKPKEALLKTPINFNQNANLFNLNTNNMAPGTMEANNMNMMNMPPMGMGGMNNMNLGNIHGFNHSISDPRSGPTPGLLGIAPNMPHNFKNNSFGGPNNFGNMPFNGPGPGSGPGNDFNFMDGDQNYGRFPSRGGHRGRGNDRWNRGNSGRGHRDRKNFNDRGSWKNDRN